MPGPNYVCVCAGISLSLHVPVMHLLFAQFWVQIPKQPSASCATMSLPQEKDTDVASAELEDSDDASRDSSSEDGSSVIRRSVGGICHGRLHTKCYRNNVATHRFYQPGPALPPGGALLKGPWWIAELM